MELHTPTLMDEAPHLLGDLWLPLDALARHVRRGGVLRYEEGYRLERGGVLLGCAPSLDELAAELEGRRPRRRPSIRCNLRADLIASMRRALRTGESMGGLVRAGIRALVAERQEEEAALGGGDA